MIHLYTMGDQAAPAPQRIVARVPEEYKLKNSFAAWIKQFQNYTELVNVPAGNLYRTFLSFMNDEAFAVVEAAGLDDAQKLALFDNLTPVREAMKARQGERIPAEYMLSLRKQEEGESIEQFAAVLERMAAEAYPQDQDIRANRQLIQCFIMGIRSDELGVKLLGENFNNLTDAIVTAAQYYKALQTRRFIKRGGTETTAVSEKVYNIGTSNCSGCNCNRNNDSQVNAVQKTVMRTEKQSATPMNTPSNQWQFNHGQQMATQMPTQVPVQVPQMAMPQMMSGHGNWPMQYQQNMQPMMGNQQPRRKICSNCQKTGHTIENCWAINGRPDGYSQGYNQNWGQQKDCTYCNKRGHTAADCWHLNPQKMVRCTNCQKPGHTVDKCYQPNRFQDQQYSRPANDQRRYPKNAQESSQKEKQH